MSFINESILLLISVLHIIVILFVVCVPFTKSNYLLILHIIVVPFILLHWILNNNTCSLTLAEKYIREKSYGSKPNDDECFTYKFIAPIYDFNKNHEAFSNFIYFATISLWLLSVYKISNKLYNGDINSYQKLFTI
jgi:c-di-AMP phosphodiesterase-like protein